MPAPRLPALPLPRRSVAFEVRAGGGAAAELAVAEAQPGAVVGFDLDHEGGVLRAAREQIAAGLPGLPSASSLTWAMAWRMSCARASRAASGSWPPGRGWPG
jgi:hypothetical protein